MSPHPSRLGDEAGRQVPPCPPPTSSPHLGDEAGRGEEARHLIAWQLEPACGEGEEGLMAAVGGWGGEVLKVLRGKV